MGGLKGSNRSSLERLKDLEALPDITLQLAEARLLCVHAVRADMIAPWLLERAKSTNQYRTHPEAWHLLLLAFRLLSPDQLAALLISHDLFATICLTLEDSQSSPTLLEAIAGVVVFLFEVSAPLNHTPVQAVLRLPATKAASLLGHWLQQISQIATAGSEESTDRSAICNPALKLWDARIPSNDDNSLFAKQCLKPAASLLSVLSNQKLKPPFKRKSIKRQGYEGQVDLTKKLEALFARHIFLPTRIAFFKTLDSAIALARPVTEIQQPTFTIAAALDPLKQAIASEIEGRQSYLAAIPLLLDVALRCATKPTPRQRAKDRPWTEALFQALHDCNKDAAGRLMSNDALIDMLQIVGRHASLSKELLENMVKSHSGLHSGVGATTNGTAASDLEWAVIAQVVSLDAELFCQPELAANLFEALTKAARNLFEAEHQPPADMDDFVNTQSKLQILWVEKIVLPIMNAFASSRNLEAFVNLWLQQLLYDGHDRLWSIWTALDAGFQAVLEVSMTENQVVNLVDRLAGNIMLLSVVADPSDDDQIPATFGPNVVVLNAALGGLRSEKLVTETTKQCEKIFGHLMQVFEGPKRRDSVLATAVASQSRIWSLLEKCFEMWFPASAASHIDPSVIAQKSSRLTSSPAIHIALNTMRRTDFQEESSLVTRTICNEAQSFVGSISSALLPYEASMEKESHNTLHNVVNDLVEQLEPSNMQMVAQRPALVAFIAEPMARQTFLSRCISAARLKDASEQVADGLQALATAAVTQKQTVVIEDFVSAATKAIELNTENHGVESKGEVAMIDETFVVLDNLSSISANSLTRTQRERLLDVMCDTSLFQPLLPEARSQKQLSIMVRLMHKPNATARLSLGKTKIWEVAVGVTVQEYVRRAVVTPPQMHNSATLALFAELGKLTVRHLLTAQDQERSRSTLLEMSHDARDMLKHVSESKRVDDHLVALSVCTSIVSELETGAKPELAAQFSHRDPKALSAIWSSLARQYIKRMRLGEDRDGEAFEAILAVLTSILHALERLPKDDYKTALRKIEQAVAQVSSLVSTCDVEQLRITAGFFSFYATLSKNVPSVDTTGLTDICLLVLDRKCAAGQIPALLTSYEDYLTRLDAVSKVGILQRLLAEEQYSLQSRLLLLERSIASLTKDDTTSTTETLAPFRLLPSLLQFLTAEEDQNILVRQRVTHCILTVLRDKPFLNNQHTIETTLATLPRLLDVDIGLSTAFTDVCRILSALFLTHRARLHGRLQHVLQIFTALITVLFNPKKTRGRPLDHTHAHTLSRLLTLFAEPLNLSRSGGATSKHAGSSLVDEARKEQAYVGRHAQVLLHHFCAQVLAGTPREGVREALMPGVWAVIEAVEAGTEEGVKVLSSAMSNSERAILRGVFEEWKRGGKWRGG